MNIRLRILLLCIGLLLIIPMVKLVYTTHDSSPVDSSERASVATPQEVVSQGVNDTMQSFKHAWTPPTPPHTAINPPGLFGSFTTLPDSLKDPGVAQAISNYIAFQSHTVATISARHVTLLYEPPSLGDGINDPTDEQIDARDAYDRAYHERKIAQAQTQDLSSRIPSIEYARSNLIQTIGEPAYAKFRQWQKAEYIASILSWHLPEETTRSSAESIVRFWVEGHTTTAIFNLVTDVSPITSDVGESIIMVLRQ